MSDSLERFHCASMMLCEDDIGVGESDSISYIQEVINANGIEFSEAFNKRINQLVDEMIVDSFVFISSSNPTRLSLYTMKALGFSQVKVLMADGGIKIGWSVRDLFLFELDYGEFGYWLVGKGQPVSTDGSPQFKTLFEFNQYFRNIYGLDLIELGPRHYDGE